MLLAARNVSKFIYRHNSRLTVENLVLNKSESKVSDKYKNAFSKLQDKIIFNSHLESQKIKLGYRRNRIIDDLVKKLEKEEKRVFQMHDATKICTDLTFTNPFGCGWFVDLREQ